MKPVTSTKFWSCLFFLLMMRAPVVGQPTDEKAIENVASQFSAAYVNGDYSAMANSYTEDAVLMSPGQDMIYGREAIYKFWSRDTSYHQTFHKTRSDKLEIVGDYAFDNGYWYSEAEIRGKKNPLSSGKYLIIWKKVGGEWKMYHDIWNNRRRDWEEKGK